MSVRMDASLYSDLVRLERGDHLHFECEQLSHDARDVTRCFFGCFYPRWHAFYLEEVRSIIGNLGYTQLRHFPAFALDVYRTIDGAPYTTADFVVGNVLVLGTPRNQRDDDVRRYKITRVDDAALRTACTRRLPSIANKSTWSPSVAATTVTTTVAAATVKGSNDGNNGDIAAAATTTNLSASMLQTRGTRVPVHVSDAVVQLLRELREAYVYNVGGGIPELGLKAMGRPCRRVGADGRRWLTRAAMYALVRDSHAFANNPRVTDNNDDITDSFGNSSSSTRNKNMNSIQQQQQRIAAVAQTLYDAFPHDAAADNNDSNDDDDEVAQRGVDYDVFMDLVRGHMNAVRKAAVRNVFVALDFNQDGYLAIHDIQAHFNAQAHPVVVHDGIFSADKLLQGWLAVWDVNTHQYGLVPYSEFEDYYNGLSCIIDRDDVFCGILDTTWKLPSWVTAQRMHV